MNQKTLLICLAILIAPKFITSFVDLTSFCELGCIKENIVHGACANPNGSLIESCPSSTRVHSMDMFKRKIVQEHNNLRNLVANGKKSPLLSASRMGEVFWDRELASLAELSSKRCLLNDSYCYRTDRMPNPGRTAALFTFNSDGKLEINEIKSKLAEWFKQAYETVANKTNIHVSRILKEQNNRLGCAMTEWVNEEQNSTVLLVCLYATDIRGKRKLYHVGEPGSMCKERRSVLYPSLCNMNENYDYSGRKVEHIHKTTTTTAA